MDAEPNRLILGFSARGRATALRPTSRTGSERGSGRISSSSLTGEIQLNQSTLLNCSGPTRTMTAMTMSAKAHAAMTVIRLAVELMLPPPSYGADPSLAGTGSARDFGLVSEACQGVPAMPACGSCSVVGATRIPTRDHFL